MLRSCVPSLLWACMPERKSNGLAAMDSSYFPAPGGAVTRDARVFGAVGKMVLAVLTVFGATEFLTRWWRVRLG